jgi:hypothetical protein
MLPYVRKGATRGFSRWPMPSAPVKNRDCAIHHGHEAHEEGFPMRLPIFVAFVAFVDSDELTGALADTCARLALQRGIVYHKNEGIKTVSIPAFPALAH